MRSIREMWVSVSLHQKFINWIVLILLSMLCSSGISMWIGQETFAEFNLLLDDNVECYEVQEVIEAEKKAFENYVREASQENQQNFYQACQVTKQQIYDLPSDCDVIGKERYARTWNLINGYEGYVEYRDTFLQMDPSAGDYADHFYRVMEIQDYLSRYALRLVQVTLVSSNQSYSAKAAMFRSVPWIFGLLLASAIVLVLSIMKTLSVAVVQPLIRLAQESRRITENDFSGRDLPVESKDEVGELTKAFNRMKHAMEEHLATQEALHREAVEKLELEKNLDHTRLEMLKSQVNPHFLFNTLNMISSMARLEDAYTTNKMIISLGNLFRYNLRTKDQKVWLIQELEALDDYIYIQRMRFDSRISFRRILHVDAHSVKIPSFLLQPVVENAFSHGLKTKRAGGRIILRIWQKKGNVMISVMDNGRGMDETELAELSQRMHDSEKTGKSIGLGNINRRISMLYPNGNMRIYSKEDRGTIIQFAIPQADAPGGETQ